MDPRTTSTKQSLKNVGILGGIALAVGLGKCYDTGRKSVGILAFCCSPADYFTAKKDFIWQPF